VYAYRETRNVKRLQFLILRKVLSIGKRGSMEMRAKMNASDGVSFAVAV
jgi:hypothetical protein